MFPSIICSDDVNSSFTMCISNNNNIFSFGRCLYGAHGHKKEIIETPKQVKTLKNIKMIACGVDHTICIDFESDTYAFGKNDNGQIGIGKTKDELKFTVFPQKLDLPPIKQVSCGYYFTICLSEDGKLYSFGQNNNSQLGLNNTDKYISPQLIPNLLDIETISCGGLYAICKCRDETYYSWGYNVYGELGQGDFDKYMKPTLCSNWPNNIISIKTKEHTLLLTCEGYVYSCGCNDFGQLGINDDLISKLNKPTLIKHLPEIHKIECGFDHSMCIDYDNKLWIFGSNSNGQCGINQSKKIKKPTLHPTLSNIIDISSGGEHVFIKTIDNKIYAMGKNDYSQLGIETSEENQSTPIQVLKGQEDIWCSTIGKSRQKSARK